MPRPRSTWELLTYADLLTYREQCGFRSDAELAEDLGVSVGSIAGWKKGVRAPSLVVQRALVARISVERASGRAIPEETADLVKRLLALAPEVQDPTALIEAAQRLLEAELRTGSGPESG